MRMKICRFCGEGEEIRSRNHHHCSGKKTYEKGRADVIREMKENEKIKEIKEEVKEGIS